MFRFEHIYYLFLLSLIPLGFLIYWLKSYQSTYDWKKLSSSDLLKINVLFAKRNWIWQQTFFALGIIFFVIALANPQFGTKKQKIQTMNTDIIIALDISNSMLAKDILPNRLSRAQLWIKQFTEYFKSDKIGLVVFAGNAYLQSPITNDIATIQLMSSMLSPASIATQGTSIKAALETCKKAFPKDQGNHKTIVLITDGEDHEGEAIEEAKLLHNDNISVISIPVGSTNGANVPAENANEYKLDENGQPVISIPNRKLLQEIADITGGELIELEAGSGIFDKLKAKFASIVKKETVIHSFSDYESYFQYFLLPGLFSFMAYIILMRKK